MNNDKKVQSLCQYIMSVLGIASLPHLIFFSILKTFCEIFPKIWVSLIMTEQSTKCRFYDKKVTVY